MTLAAVLTGCDRVQSCDRAVYDLRQPTTTECDRAYERRPPLGADRTSIIQRAPTRHEDLATPADARRRPGNGDYVGDGLCVIRIRTRRTSIALERDATATIISGRRLTRWISSAQRHLDSGRENERTIEMPGNQRSVIALLRPPIPEHAQNCRLDL